VTEAGRVVSVCESKFWGSCQLGGQLFISLSRSQLCYRCPLLALVHVVYYVPLNRWRWLQWYLTSKSWEVWSLWCGILSLLLRVRIGYALLWSKVGVSCTDIEHQRSGIYFFNILNLWNTDKNKKKTKSKNNVHCTEIGSRITSCDALVTYLIPVNVQPSPCPPRCCLHQLLIMLSTRGIFHGAAGRRETGADNSEAGQTCCEQWRLVVKMWMLVAVRRRQWKVLWQ